MAGGGGGGGDPGRVAGADPATIGEALGMPTLEATKLLTRHKWREDDVALLEAAAARLELVGQ
jgi:hypothetical protein